MRPDAASDWLEQRAGLRQQDIHLGLDRVRAVHQRLGAPLPAGIVVTVTGTNGKGSCIALLDAMLRAGGYRVGCYTSPHLQRLGERIRIDGAAVDDGPLLAALEQVDRARDDIPLTYFEFVTLAALLLLAEAGPNVALLEVGLGGRLDAVNVVDADVAVVTRIALDHQDRLGDDRDAIGREKAGIMRESTPAVCGDADPPQALLAHAEALRVPLSLAGRDFRVEPIDGGWHFRSRIRQRLSLPPPALRGAHQLDNAATALMALDCLGDRLPIDQRAVRAGLLQASLPGRMTVYPGRPTWVLDVAHNPDAVAALARNLGQQFVPGATHVLLGMLAGRDVAACVGPLRGRVDHWHLTSLADARALSASHLHEALAGAVDAPLSVHTDVPAAIAAIRELTSDEDRVVVFGSFATVAEAMAVLDGA